VRKKLTVFVLFGLALVLLAGPALAAGTSRTTYAAKNTNPYSGRKPHVVSLTGTVTAVTSGSISISVQMTNAPYRYLRGKPLTINMNNKTACYVWSDNGKTRSRITVSQLVSYVNARDSVRVSINAREDPDNVFTARRVEVAKPRYK
jgi:hypothetical protein